MLFVAIVYSAIDWEAIAATSFEMMSFCATISKMYDHFLLFRFI